MKIFFRVDYTPITGLGHMARCSFLAEAFEEKGLETVFLTEAQTLPNFLRVRNFQKPDTAWEKETGNVLVVDSYLLDAQYESSVKPSVKKLVVLDDLANRRHDCDVLVDCGYHRKPSDYAPFVSASTKLLLGLPYCMISNSFRRLKTLQKDCRRIHLFFGSTVSFSTLIEHYIALKRELPGSYFTLAHATHISPDERILWNTHRSDGDHLFCEEPLSVSLQGCSLAVGSPGVAVWERAFLDIPGFYISVNENQVQIIRDLERLGFCRYLGPVDQVTENIATLKTWLSDQTVSRLQVAIAGKVDGLGISRIVDEVLR